MNTESTVHSWMARVRDRAESIARRHDAGRLHLRVQNEESLCDSAEDLDCPCVRLETNDRVQADDLVPRELRRELPLELPLDLAAARSRLRERKQMLDAIQIDLHQLGVLVCRLTTGNGPGDYVRSPRAKGKLPIDVRVLIERACGIDGQSRFENVREFLGLLSRIESRNQVLAGGRGSNGAEQENDPCDPQLVLPDRLGQYELLGQIGSGGMGEVHLARDSSLGRRVAIKILPRELARQDDFVRRFYSEAAAAARVIHPNVIPIHFIGEDLGYHYFVMPCIEGESLAQLLKRQGRLSPSETVHIARDVLNGLQAAHDHHLIHRDIKPGNVLLERGSGRAIVADFGLVKSATGGEGRTATGVILGTADYMSPEQGRGHPIDHRSDLYAMGVMLYQMLSGRLPFAADSLTAMIFQHVYERPIPLPELSHEVPERFWCIVRCLLAKSPSLRYASARQVRDDLVAASQNRPLPSKAEQIDPEDLWHPTPGMKSAEETPRIVHAPVLDDDFNYGIDQSTPEETNRFFSWIRSLFFFHRPREIAALESTEQQADGAIAEYERRQKQLRSLVDEGDSVLVELRSQPATGSDDASLRLLIEKQSSELDSMRVKLARVGAVLQQLRGQRAVLHARLKTARARAGLTGEKTHPRSLRELPRHPRAFALPAVLFTIASLIAWVRFGGSPEEASLLEVAENSSNRIAGTGDSTVQPAPALANNTLERRFSLSGDGLRAVVAQHRGLVRVSTPSTTGQPVDAGLTIWDLQSGRQIGALRSPLSATDVAMSRDGSLVVGIGRNSETGKSGACLWEVPTGNLRHAIESIDITDRSGAGFSPDGGSAYVTLGSPDLNTLGIIDCISGRMEQMPFSSVVRAVTCAAFSPARNMGVFAVETLPEFGGPSLHVYDLTERRLAHSIRPSSGRGADALAFSGNGELLAVTANGVVQILETHAWSETKTLHGAERPSYRLAVSSDGRYLARARSGSVELWSVQPEVVTRLTPQNGSLDIQFGHNDTLIVVSPFDRFTFFDSSTGQETLGLIRHER